MVCLTSSLLSCSVPCQKLKEPSLPVRTTSAASCSSSMMEAMCEETMPMWRRRSGQPLVSST